VKCKSVKVMGKSWNIQVLKTPTWQIKFDDSSAALCDESSRTLFFHTDHISLGTIRHEVRHAFISECCVRSAQLSGPQKEEINADLDAERWNEMDRVSKSIFKNIKKHKTSSEVVLRAFPRNFHRR